MPDPAYPHPRIELGSAIFALIEPHVGYEREFNRWYERDHVFTGGMLAPWTLSTGRWVATRDLKALRLPAATAGANAVAEPLGAGSYLTAFFMQKDRLEDQQRFVAASIAELPDARKTFEQRDHVSTHRYAYKGGAFRDEDGVPAELALDHRFPGVACSWLERTPGTSLDELSDWLQRAFLPQWQKASAIAMTLVFELLPKPDFWPAAIPEPPGLGERLLLVHFLESEPTRCWGQSFAALPQAIDASGRARLLLSAPFIPTEAGSDRYVDELR